MVSRFEGSLFVSKLIYRYFHNQNQPLYAKTKDNGAPITKPRLKKKKKSCETSRYQSLMQLMF